MENSKQNKSFNYGLKHHIKKEACNVSDVFIKLTCCEIDNNQLFR